MSSGPPNYALMLSTKAPQRPGPIVRRARTNLAQVVRDRVPAERLVETLVTMMDDPTQDPRIRLAVIDRLLDRGWGKPAQTVHVESSLTGDDELDGLEDVSDAELIEAVAAAESMRSRLGLVRGE